MKYKTTRYDDDKMIEICRVRERLWAFKNRVQPYPVEVEPVEPEPPILQPTNIPLDTYVQQRRLILHLQEKVNQLLSSKKNQSNRYNDYK